jgi:DHA1 family multidrug resistance protein-like MFS transporter
LLHRSSPALVGGIVFAISAAAFSRIPLLPELGGELSLTAGEIGLLITGFGLGRLLMDLPAGRMAAAVPPAGAFLAAGAGLAAASALLATSGSLAQALIASSLMGSASALTNTTGMYSFATGSGAERRGASMAMFTTALMLGQMAGPALGGALGAVTGWRPAIAVSGAVGVAVVLVCLAWQRPGGVQAAVGRSPAGAREPGSAAPVPDARTPAGIPARSELVAIAAAPFATFFALAGLTQTLIPLIGDAELGLSPATIGIAIGIGAAARFLGTWVAGVGSDRLSRKVVLVPSLLLMSLGAGVLVVPLTAVIWVAAILLLALGASGITVAAATLADRVPEPELGRELGLFRLIGDLGLLIGPIAAGFLYQESGAGLAGGVSAGVFAAAALVAARWIPGPPRRGGFPRGVGRDRGEELLVE